MTRLFILIRKKGTKKFLGAKPIRKGTSKEKIRKLLSKMPKSYQFRIISQTQLEKIIRSNIKPKRRRK